MGIFSPGWTFSPVDRAESKTDFAITWREFEPGLPGWNFSPVWDTRDEIFSPVDRAEIPNVIDKKFQSGLKIHKRMRRTLVYNSLWNFPCNRVIISALSTGWNFSNRKAVALWLSMKACHLKTERQIRLIN